MGYDTVLEVYYHKSDVDAIASSGRLAPAPQINISPEMYYANDNIIGYTYNITLNGYANSLRKELNTNSGVSSFSGTINHIGDIRDIFNFDGGHLTIKYQNGQDVLIAKGCTIKNLQFNNSENKMVNYAQYTAELEFNEVDFIGCTDTSIINCASSILHSPYQDEDFIIDDGLVDIKKYKIKDFNDKWTFTIDENIYNIYGTEKHQSMKVSYTLSATGKNYYVGGNLVPAWQQAKLFVQDKLYREVNQLVDQSIKYFSTTGCDSASPITELSDPSKGDSLLSGFDTSFGIYNETITCDTSESEGTFSITYEATLKYGLNYAATHTFTHNMQYVNDDVPETTINVQGTVQGLTPGGFINQSSANDFSLPQNGQFIVSAQGNNTRYKNALTFYEAFIGDNNDLSTGFKALIGVIGSALAIQNAPAYPSPQSFQLDHNYNTGELSYNVVYSSKHQRKKDNKTTNISITRSDPTEIFQEFVIPGRTSGPLIQKLNMYTPRTVSINIDGADLSLRGSNIAQPCSIVPNLPQEAQLLLADEGAGWLKTKDNRSINKIDGSYSFSLEYTCLSRN